MRTRPISIFLVLVFLGAPALDAQELRTGSRVRVHLHQPPPLTGPVEALSADTLWVRTDRMARPIPLPSIRRLELRRRVTRAQGGWTWAKRGFAVGALLGAITCLADQEECVSDLGPSDGLAEGLLSASLFLGGGAAFLGFAAGAAIPGHRWIEIPVPLGGAR